MLGRLDQQLDVIDGPLQVGAEVGEPAVEVVVGEQAEDRDAQAAGGGDEGFGNAAAHLGRRQLLVADEAERAA